MVHDADVPKRHLKIFSFRDLPFKSKSDEIVFRSERGTHDPENCVVATLGNWKLSYLGGRRTVTTKPRARAFACS